MPVAFFRIALLPLWALWALASLNSAAAAETRIRMLLPRNPYHRQADKALLEAIEQFHQSHPQIRVILDPRGDGYSSLKELVALKMAEDAPEIAVIDASESAAIEPLGLAQPIQLTGRPQTRFLPFRHTLPVVVVDQEVRLRAGLPASGPPTPSTWEELLRQSGTLARFTGREKPTQDPRGLSVPLQGALGLWILEALVDKPLFLREAGGIKTNAHARPEIARLQHLTEGAAPLFRAEDGWERATQAFIDRSAPMIVTSLDMLPHLREQASFRWDFGPLPLPKGGVSRLQTGSDLVVTRPTPEVRTFLEFLYAPARAARWISEGSFVPTDLDLAFSVPWKKVLSQAPQSKSYEKVLAETRKGARLRATDPAILRTRSDWIQALRLLFGEPSRRQSAESVLNQMDAQRLSRQIDPL